MATRDRHALRHGIGHELAVRLERATDLSERAKRANDAAQHEIERAKAIADALRGVSLESSARADELRSRRRDR